MRRRASACLAAIVVLAGCGQQPPTADTSPQFVELPPYVPGPNSGCAGAEPPGVTVHLDPDADPPAWFEWEGRRLEVLWPSGHRLLVEPLGIIGPQGDVILRDGDTPPAIAICSTADDDLVIFHSIP